MDIAFSGMPIHSKQFLIDEMLRIKDFLNLKLDNIVSAKPIISSKVPILKLIMRYADGDIKIDMLLIGDYGYSLARLSDSVHMILDI